MTGVMLEVGPAIVRRLSPDPAPHPDRAAVTTALDGIDDTIVLLEEHPVDVAALWRSIIAPILASHCESVTIIHPTWWPERRVDRVVDAATSIAKDVVALARSELIAQSASGRTAVVIEIGGDVIALCRGGEPVAVLARPADGDAVADRAISVGGSTAQMIVDAPCGVVGAAECAVLIRKALSDSGVPAAAVRIEDVVPPAVPTEAVTTECAENAPRRLWFSPRVVAAASVAAVMCGVGIATARPNSPAPIVAASATDLVEGRIAVRIPLHWDVERVTAGPGSRRVQVTSPTDRDAALHITASYVPGETLSQTAELLERRVAEQPAGVFVDFDPSDERVGRPAVTYREVRVGRDIRWVVLRDGSMRISIGCQSAPGREDDIRDACDGALRSARELTGTEERP